MASGTYNSNALVNQLSDAVSMDSKVKAEAWSKALHLGALGYDDLAAFETSEVKPGSKASLDPGTPMGVICRKTDFNKIGGDKMNFTVMGAPAGPGVQGEEELTGSTSTPTWKTFSCVVDYKRDGVEYTKKHLKMMATGGSIMRASYMYMAQKMGLRRQREMLLSLRDFGTTSSSESVTNYVNRAWAFRPNNRSSRDTILATDVLDITNCVAAKIRATRNGCRPLRVSKNRYGSRVHGYMVFATETSMQGIRGSEGYELALQHSQVRGDANPQFTGRLVEWQKLAWFEHSVVDPDWDDVKGSPLEPRATIARAYDGYSADPALYASSTAASQALYFQDFLGYQLEMYEGQASAEDWSTTRSDSNTYYAWVLNPSGTKAFVAYTKSGITAPSGSNYGQNIVLSKILDPDDEHSTGKGYKVVGNIDATGDTAWGSNGGSPIEGAGGVGPGTSANHTYTTKIEADAVVIQANANGVPIGWSLLFGAYAAVRGYGQTDLTIQESRDWGFVKGAGYEGIWGQNTALRADGRTNGYQLIEHAIEPEGYEIPSVDADGNVVN